MQPIAGASARKHTVLRSTAAGHAGTKNPRGRMTKKNSNDRQTNIRMVGDKIATPTPSYRTVRDQTEACDGMQSWP